jgi:transposase
MGGKTFSEEDRILAKEMLGQGHTLTFISETLGRREDSVRRWAARLGLVRAYRPWNDKEKALLLDMREKGSSVKEIAEALVRSSDSVTSMLSSISRQRNVAKQKGKPLREKSKPHQEPYIAWMIAQEKIRRRGLTGL